MIMKKTLRLFIIFLVLPVFLFAGEPVKQMDNDPVTNELTARPTDRADSAKPWLVTAHGRMSLNQVSFTNWAEGGESLISGNTYGNLKANYLNNKWKVDNFITIGYGLTWNDEQGVRKSDDKMDIGTNLGYEAFEDFFYSLILNLKTQFSEGYKYPNDSVVVSRFFSPATFFMSMGLEYKPDEHTSVFISPASGKFTFVMDQDLADIGAFGVTPAVTDTAGTVLIPGLNYKSKFGVNVIFSLNRDLMKNINFDTKLNLHNNYMDELSTNRWNFDVDWETALNFKINSFLSSILYMHVLYDNDIPIPTYEKIGGEKIQIGEGPKVQVKENFGIGITIKV